MILHATIQKMNRLILITVVASAALVLSGCDLSPETFDTISPEEFYQTEDEFRAAVVPVYNQLGSISQGQYWWNSEVSTDEAIVPTRGQDWDDNGVWRRLHTQSWTPTDPAAGSAWSGAYTGVARANTVLSNLEQSTLDESTLNEFAAEVRTLRAFFYYTLMDLFGGVPIVTAPAADPDNPPSDTTRRAVFNFVETELKESLPNLPLERSGANTGRVTKGAARAILANMYLNAEVFKGEVTESGLQRAEPMYTEAVAEVDAIIDSGVYSLADNFFQNFALDNHTSPEVIFAKQNVEEGGPGLGYHFKVLHYNQWPTGCCNGLATLPGSYDTFSDDDLRKDMFLEGRARNLYTDEPAFNREGDPLIFTKEVPLTGASEGAGIRPMKWPVNPNNTTGSFKNDYAFFRLAEMYMIKAEALWRMNGPNQESVDLMNRVRERAFDPDQPIDAGDLSEEFFLNERTREFHSEAKRRQDLIRFGKFTSEIWAHKEESEPYRVLFPVPQSELDSNPNLTQNPGY
jgi:hypothetical protein